MKKTILVKQEKHSDDKDNSRETTRVTSILSLKKRQRPIRYFVMKCVSFNNLEIALQNHIWATQAHNEDKLNQAYRNSEVVLVFSVNNSRHFQAYGRMASRIGSKSSSIWHHNQKILGGLFHIEWICVHDLPFHESEHLYNPLNENKPVKIAKDGQEIPEDIGFELCQLIDNAKDSHLTPYMNKEDNADESFEILNMTYEDYLKSHRSENNRISSGSGPFTGPRGGGDHRGHGHEGDYRGHSHEGDYRGGERHDPLRHRSRDQPYHLSPHHRRVDPRPVIASHLTSMPSSNSFSRSHSLMKSHYHPGTGIGGNNNWYNEINEVDYMSYLIWLKQKGSYNPLPGGYYGNNTGSFQKRRR